MGTKKAKIQVTDARPQRWRTGAGSVATAAAPNRLPELGVVAVAIEIGSMVLTRKSLSMPVRRVVVVRLENGAVTGALPIVKILVELWTRVVKMSRFRRAFGPVSPTGLPLKQICK